MSAPVVAGSIAATPPVAPVAGAIVISATVPAATDALRAVAAKVTHAPSPARPPQPYVPRQPVDSARWWILGGALLIGVATFLAVAQWQPKPRRPPR